MEIPAIKQYMKVNKITYDELAKRTGLSKSCITKIFAGYAKYPRIDTMQAIETALELNRPNEWTAEDKASGIIPAYREKLSPDETELLDAYRAIKEEKGDKAAQAVRTIIKAFLDGN